MLSRSTFALWTIVRCLRRRRASSNAATAIRSTAARVMTPIVTATSAVGMNSPVPANVLRSA
jgi:hypothetical protein